MSLRTRLRDRLRPWHGLMLAVFLAGAGTRLMDGARPLFAVLVGLFWLVIFQFTVGNVWGYAVEYRNAGGDWGDAAFVAPFAVAFLAGATLYAVSRNLGAAASAAFWVFVAATAVTAVVVNLLVGYREGDPDADGSQLAE
ncbi:hypothetical protein [Halobaculum magnesiiphilum]|uniref:Uncharacterized protein n=1 Tax=Halobaculum magnesiiphilum TaxID=1017351 RepID=A0A8T8WG72_9EURY|nr:hypothetical protein [Halobaculum magnesiiphilum]QZP38859.1 hypothetical protein K6T50_06915 [Halobaculum magnesiiphilum]